MNRSQAVNRLHNGLSSVFGGRRAVWGLRASLVAMGLTVTAQGSAFAQTNTWIAGSGSWSVTSNWSAGVLPGSGTTADIAGAPGTVVNLLSGSTGPTGMPVFVRAGNKLLGAGTDVTNGVQRLGNSSTVNNAGTIENALLFGGTVTNSGTIQAAGAGKFMVIAQVTTVNNTANGVISASDGGTLAFSPTGGAATMSGGSVGIGTSSTLRTQGSDGTATASNVTVTNNGTTRVDLSADSANNRNLILSLTGTTTFDNYGTTVVRFTSGTVTGTAGTTKTVSMQVGSTATFTNRSTGILNIQQFQTNNPSNFTLSSFFQLNAAGFNNEGTINISTTGSSTGSARFRTGTAVGFANAGVIEVDGPLSSIEMNTGTFTQTAGSLSLVNGGRMTAGSVLINSGTLLGTGTIAAPVTIGGILSPGSGGIGTLSVSNNVTWNAGNAWRFELGTPGATLAAAISGSSSGDLLALTGGFSQGTGSTFTFDFANTGTDGWYKLVDYASTTFTSGTNTNGFQATNLPAGKSANFVVDSGSTALYVQIVPEPGTLALAGIGIGMGYLTLWKRRRRA